MTRRILLIDDNPNDLELALTALDASAAPGGEAYALPTERPGEPVRQEIMVARSGVEALARLRAMLAQDGGAALPDLILLDLNMAQMNGLDVLDAVRADAELRDIPVVMLSTSGEDGDIRRSYAHGASGYVIKPIDFTQFREVMQTIQAFWTNLNRRPRLN